MRNTIKEYKDFLLEMISMNEKLESEISTKEEEMFVSGMNCAYKEALRAFEEIL